MLFENIELLESVRQGVVISGLTSTSICSVFSRAGMMNFLADFEMFLAELPVLRSFLFAISCGRNKESYLTGIEQQIACRSVKVDLNFVIL